LPSVGAVSHLGLPLCCSLSSPSRLIQSSWIFDTAWPEYPQASDALASLSIWAAKREPESSRLPKQPSGFRTRLVICLPSSGKTPPPPGRKCSLDPSLTPDLDVRPNDFARNSMDFFARETGLGLAVSDPEEKSGKIATADMPAASIFPSIRGFRINWGALP